MSARPRRRRARLRKPKNALGMNGLEMKYAAHLDMLKLVGEIEEWRFEWIKLRLARNAWYTPDFWVLFPDGHVEIHETKGRWMEAARVRIRVAAEMHPWFTFFGIQDGKKQGWIVEEFSSE